MKKKLLLSAVSLLAITSIEANAAGFQLTENSTVSMGRAFGGAGVVGDDLSAIANNAAGMSLFKGDIAVQGGTTLVNLRAPLEATINDVVPADAVATSLSAIPQGYAVKRINDKMTVGFGISTPFGLESEYDMDWGNGYGGLFGVRSYIATVDFNPSVSYKVTDKLSVGMGLSAQYLKAVLTSNNIPVTNPFGGADIPSYFKVKGDSWGFGYDIGAMYEFNDNTRVGLSYRSKVDHDVEGTTYVGAYNTDVDGTTANVVLPETVILSGFHKVNDKFGLSGIVKWTNWSRFQELAIYNPQMDPSITPENWRDTWSAGVGVDYYANQDLTLRFGLGYDMGAVDSPEFRTARIPDSDRIQLGLGASWKYNESITVDFGYMHLFMLDADIVHPASTAAGAPVLSGTFEPYADLFSVAVQIKF